MKPNGGTVIACVRPDLSASVVPYCFGDISDAERDRFEEHVLRCEACWHEVRRLDEAVRALRRDRQAIRSAFGSDVVAGVGISSRLKRPFAGHTAHVAVASLLYASLFAVSLPMELAYQWQQYGSWSIRAAIPIFIWVLASTLLVLGLHSRRIALGKPASATMSSILLGLPAAMLYLVLRSHLPSVGVTESSLQAATAQSAYLKGMVYFVPAGIFLLLHPYVFVVAMQREIAGGRHAQVNALLTGSPAAIPPRGVFFPPFWVLGGVVGVATVISFIMLMYLLDHLKPGPNMNLFSILVEGRWLLYLLLCIECLRWYWSSVDELKRECLAHIALAKVLEQ